MHTNDYRAILDRFKAVSYQMSGPELAVTFACFFQAYYGPYAERRATRQEMNDTAYRLDVAPPPVATLTKWRVMGYMNREVALQEFARRVMSHAAFESFRPTL